MLFNRPVSRSKVPPLHKQTGLMTRQAHADSGRRANGERTECGRYKYNSKYKYNNKYNSKYKCKKQIQTPRRNNIMSGKALVAVNGDDAHKNERFFGESAVSQL